MIIAIDPGNEFTAWCCLQDGKPVSFGKECNETVMVMLKEKWAKDSPLAIEMVASYGMAVGKEILETVLWIGRYLEAWEGRGGKAELIYRKDVKLHHCYTVKANDSNIRAAIIDKFGGTARAVGKKKTPGPLFGIAGDVWSALAIAMLAAEKP